MSLVSAVGVTCAIQSRNSISSSTLTLTLSTHTQHESIALEQLQWQFCTPWVLPHDLTTVDRKRNNYPCFTVALVVPLSPDSALFWIFSWVFITRYAHRCTSTLSTLTIRSRILYWLHHQRRLSRLDPFFCGMCVAVWMQIRASSAVLMQYFACGTELVSAYPRQSENVSPTEPGQLCSCVGFDWKA